MSMYGMSSSSGLGVNITPDLVNDFFSIKPKGQQQQKPLKYMKHHAATSGTMTGITTGGITPGTAFNINDVNYFEQSLKLRGMDESDEELEQVEDINEFLLPEPIDEMYKTAPQEMSTEVYDNYSFAHTYDESLTITCEHELVIQTIEANRVTVIEGSTGSGKTTQVPQYILDHYQQRGKFCNILVTQPRKIAAMSVAKRVSQERNWPLGTLVGYQIARDRQISEDTRITYLTTGVLLQKLVKNKHLNDYTHVILDEVHERDQDIDFSMLVVRKYLKTVSKHVKVVLMSATADCSLFSNYFSILINNRKEGAPVLSVGSKMYDVHEYYFEDLRVIDPPQQTIYDPEISDKCYKLCADIVMGLDRDELDENYEPGKLSEQRGTVLAFLPGVPEIKRMQNYLLSISDRCKLKIIPLHSQISNIEQGQIFVPPKKGERKVILSTNIAESSVTVSDIKYVIDFCLTKVNETDRDTKYQRLVLQWASKASLIQRRGRAGRVSEGHCFRLISKHFYNEFVDYGVPEMLRAPLERVILQVKLLELGPAPSMTLQLALQPPQISDIKTTILLLKEVGALTIRQNGKINPLDGDITFVGRVLGSLPVSVNIGKLLLMGYTFGVTEECLVIGACLSLKSIFTKPFNDEHTAYNKKMRWSSETFCDMLSSLNAFLAWKYNKLHRGFGQPERVWAKDRWLEWKRFKEVDELVEDLRKRLLEYNIQTHRNIYNRDSIEKDDELILKLVIAGAFYPNYFNSREIDEAEAAKALGGYNPSTTVAVHGAPPTICHYVKKVQQLFRKCGVGERLHFNNTKVFVEFKKDLKSDLPVEPAVYLALKMKHIGSKLEFLVSKERDEVLRLKSKKPKEESCNPETGLRTARVNIKLEDNFQGKAKLNVTSSSKQVILKDSGYIPLCVYEIISPGHFWATYVDTTNQYIYAKINRMGGKNLSVLDEEQIQVGVICLAPFEGEFFRAEIKNVTSSIVECFFVDFGNSEIISDRRMIRRCPSTCMDYPHQAFECYLSEIWPVQGTWSTEAKMRFRDLVPVGTKKFVGKIYSQIHNTYRLVLYDGNTNINRLLISEEYALYKEESLLSKSRHDEMANMENVRFREEASSIFVEEVEEEPRYNEEVIKINLRGPDSPYELEFGSLTKIGAMKVVRIERDSVNSVLVSDEQEVKSVRFLVAACITMNPTGDAMNARETCLLPNIRGLTGILSLLFSPEAELRCDKKRTHIIGALCGLGCDDRGEGILDDHDMEISFNVKFGESDLMLINSVRFLINEAIGIDLEKIEHAPRKIALIQECARSKLTELIDARREHMEPVSFPMPHRWKEVEESCLLDSGQEEKPAHLYVYHKGIFFNEERTTDPRIEENRANLRRFHEMAGESLVPFTREVVCPVCQVICRHPRGLYLHCETRSHRSWTEALL